MNSQEYVIPITGYEMIEKTAKRSGNSAYVYLPAKWSGKKVKIIALEPVDDEEK